VAALDPSVERLSYVDLASHSVGMSFSDCSANQAHVLYADPRLGVSIWTADPIRIWAATASNRRESKTEVGADRAFTVKVRRFGSESRAAALACQKAAE
jgi:hypothetical protein